MSASDRVDSLTQFGGKEATATSGSQCSGVKPERRGGNSSSGKFLWAADVTHTDSL